MAVKRLGIVPCHAPFEGTQPFRETDWILEPYQRDGGHHLQCFVSHAQAALAWLDSNPNARLVFSGGFSRDGCTRSEAASYLEVGKILGLIRRPEVRARISLEEYARDSFENIVNSLALFFELECSAPEAVTCFGFRFKGDRLRGHFEFLRLSGIAFEFVGLNDPNPPQLEGAWRNEAATRAAFQSNPFSADLDLKRQTRNPQRRTPQFKRCRADWPEVGGMIEKLHHLPPLISEGQSHD